MEVNGKFLIFTLSLGKHVRLRESPFPRAIVTFRGICGSGRKWRKIRFNSRRDCTSWVTFVRRAAINSVREKKNLWERLDWEVSWKIKQSQFLWERNRMSGWRRPVRIYEVTILTAIWENVRVAKITRGSYISGADRGQRKIEDSPFKYSRKK